MQQIAKSAHVFEGAVVIGEVQLDEQSSVWANAVLRGDLGPIYVGARSNIQDGCVLHCDRGDSLHIGEDVTVGHLCILHGCQVGNGSLVGMGSILMNDVKVGAGCVVGAGSLLTEGTEIPDGMMAFGRPAKVVRPVSEEEKSANMASAEHYVALMESYP